MLRVMLDKGAKPIGDPPAVPCRRHRRQGSQVRRRHRHATGLGPVRGRCQPAAQRFYDEGEDFWPKRYAIWGRLVAQQPDQIAYCIIDSKSIDLFMPSVFPPIEAGSIRGMAGKLELDSTTLDETLSGFNRAVRPGAFDPGGLDGCLTVGLDPPKSHWAVLLDSPPFYAYPLRPGITFTYLSLTVNQRAQSS